MVSKARVDLPDPDRPVITTSLFFGISTLMSFRLCCLAPLTIILSCIMKPPNMQAHRELCVSLPTFLETLSPFRTPALQQGASLSLRSLQPTLRDPFWPLISSPPKRLQKSL